MAFPKRGDRDADDWFWLFEEVIQSLWSIALFAGGVGVAAGWFLSSALDIPRTPTVIACAALAAGLAVVVVRGARRERNGDDPWGP